VGRPLLDHGPKALTIAEFAFAILTATLVIRPLTPLPPWIDIVVWTGLALAALTVVLYVVGRAVAPPPRRPSLAIVAALGWVAVFVAALGPLGAPPPWWFGASPAHWLASFYAANVPQGIGLAMVVIGLLDAGAMARRGHVARA
jgi:hypothetical protein